MEARGSTSHTAEEHSLHPRRLRILFKKSWLLLVALPAICMTISIVSQLFDVPHYVSEARVAMQAYTMGKLMGDTVLAPNDLVDDATRLQSIMAPLGSEALMLRIADVLLKSENASKLVLIEGEGFGIQMRYLLYKVTFGLFKIPKVDVKKLTAAELASYIEPLVQASPMVTERSIDLKVVAVDGETAQIVNSVVVSEFMKAARDLDRKELNAILDLFAEQAKTTQAHLDELETKLADFLKTNPGLSNDAATSNVYGEYSRLKLKKLSLEKGIEANTALLGYFKRKMRSMDPDSVAGYETIEKLQKDLVELKYSRLRLKQLQYADENPGVKEIDKKIEDTEGFIKGLKENELPEGGPATVQAESFQKEPVAKLQAIQELIVRDKFELRATDEALTTIEVDLKDFAQKGLLRNYFRREIESFTLVHAETFKRWQMISMRSASEKGNFFVSEDPTSPKRPINLPFSKKFLFSIFIGLACALSIVLILESLSPKVIERGDLEADGFIYSGRYNTSAASRAEILGTMGIISNDGPGALKTEIILCASPSGIVDIQYFEPLAKYLADRSKKALLVVVGHTAIPEGYEKVSTSRFAHFFQYPGGNEDLIWVLENDAFDAVKSVLDKYKSSYHTVFLFVHGAYDSSVYSLCQKMADKLLLVGAVGAHTLKDYTRLTNGFSKVDAMYVTLLASYGVDRLSANIKNIQSKVIQKLFKKTFDSAPPQPSVVPEEPAKAA
ncbi:MAG: hypothetical protein HY074_17625 [Deltaproteobacteria bacterium]|nr:hypothetical protein [Deltaproteobacteria bacterium]